MKKRFLSIILTIAVILGNLPMLSFAADGETTPANQQQVEYAGGWNNENPMPEDGAANSQPYETTGTLYKDRIAVSKTIEGTDVENYFDITLKIVAKQRVIDQSVDVVLVLDNSNTMNATHQNLYPGSYGYNANDSRIAHGKNAVSKFIDKFAIEENISQDRRLGVVTFNSYANTVVPLTTLNTAEQATNIKTSLNNITAPNGDRERFTNIEGGLQLAYNLLKDSDAVYKYVIFVTDGFPTTYIESGRESTTQIVGWDTFEKDPYTAANLEKDGFFADAITGKRCTSGVNYSDKAADRADDIAALIKSTDVENGGIGANIFSIGIDVGVQSIADYVATFANSTISTVDRRSTNYVIGDTKESYQYWLSHSIAGGVLVDTAEKTETIHRYAEGNSAEQLETAFANILSDMELIPAETLQEAYTIDPMSDYVEFLNFYNDYVDGAEVDKITHTTTGADVAAYDEANRAITWWLANTQSWNYDDTTGNYELYIRYRVRLKNEEEGFNPSTAFSTNDETTFYFKTIDLTSGDPLYGDNEINYRIPEVEGYLGELVFTKQDSITKTPLEGAEFKLTHDVDSCDICDVGGADHEDRPVIATQTASSDVDGKVTFSNVPSGHEYVLSETKAPEGYQPGTSHTVMVEYGKTALHGEEINADNPGVVENDKIVHAELVLTAKKNLVGRNLAEGEFTFALDGQRMNGLEYHERHHINANGEVTFDKIIFDREGTFKFKVYEIAGTDSTVIYDKTEYEVECTVTLNDEKTACVLETKVDGQDIDNDSAPVAFEFTNTLREKGQAQFTAKKYLDGEAPIDGEFTFELTDENGDVIQSKTNVGSDVTFDAIEYEKEGVYTYTITEQHNCIIDGVQSDDPHIFYDHSVYTATVTVTTPENDGAFETSVEYVLSDNNQVVNEVVFYNKTRKSSKLHIKANKTLDGLLPENEQFTFELRDQDGNLVESAKNDENGVITFSTLEFNDIGVKYYTVNEVKENDENIIYDKLVYMVYVVCESFHNNDSYLIDVTVAKSVEDGYYESIHRVFDGTEVEITVGAGIDFVNTTREGAEVNLTAKKTLDGVSPATDKIFTFELKDEQGNVVDTKTNNGEEITFETLTFNKSGVYNYTINEVVENDETIIYDTSVYNVKITVTAPVDSDDKYQAVVEITKDGVAYEGTPIFANTTKEIPTEPITEPPTTETTEPTTEAPTTEATEPTTEAPTTEVTEPTTEVPTTEPETVDVVVTIPKTTTPKTTVSKATVSKETEAKTTKPVETTKTSTADEIPKTGDNSNMMLWIVLLFVSGGLFTKVLLPTKKNSKK